MTPTRTRKTTAIIDIGPVETVPLGEGRAVVADGVRIGIFRPRDGGVFAVQAECPHQGGPLTDGLLGGRTVVCPLHEYKFDIQSGSPVGNTCKALKTYRATVDARGHVLVEVITGEPAQPARAGVAP